MGNLGISTIEQVARFTSVPPQMNEEAKNCVLGANLWTEKIATGRQGEYMLFPRLFVMAQQLWCCPQEADETLAKRELLERFCGKLDLVCYRGPSA